MDIGRSAWIRGAVLVAVVAGNACAGGAPVSREPLGAGDGVCRLVAGEQERAVLVGGAERRYSLRVGREAVREGGAPLVFLWHAYGQSVAAAEDLLRPDRDWPEAIVVTAKGLPRTRGSSVSRERGWQVRTGELGDRDLELFDAMVAELLGSGCVDPARVYSVGFSNGAFFSNLLGCVRSDVLAAIVPVAGAGPMNEVCEGRMPALILHGRRDDVVPFATAERSLAHWQRQNECRAAEPVDDRCVGLPDCRGGPVGFCTHSGGHVWPGLATVSAVEFFKGIRKR